MCVGTGLRPISHNAGMLAGVPVRDAVGRMFGMDRTARNAMRAVVVRRFGPPEVMRVDHIECPHPARRRFLCVSVLRGEPG